MNDNWAAEHLVIIRTLMERSAIYRRALAPISTYVGVVGVLAAIAGWLFKIETSRRFAAYWMAVSLVALAGAVLLVRRQALRELEAFWSPPTRRVALAMVPPLFVGMFLGVLLVVQPGRIQTPPLLLIIPWTFFYGCALHSAGFFMPRGIRWLGWVVILAGCGLMGSVSLGLLNPNQLPPHLLMGSIFGGLHLAYGIYLYFTERKTAA
jgi:hypothetical protein